MLDEMLLEMSENAMSEKVEQPIDRILARFTLETSVARDAAECQTVWGTFTQQVYVQVITPDGMPSMERAIGFSRDILSHQGRRQGKTVNAYILDCLHNYDGAMPAALRAISEGLKADGIRHRLDDICDRFISPVDFKMKVRVVREIITRFGFLLPAEVRTAQPEQYASQYREVIQSLYEAMKEAGRSYRRL